MRAGYALQAAGASPRLDDFLRLTRVLAGSLRARIELSGRVRFAQRSIVTRFQRRLPLTCASGSGKSSRRTYRQTLGLLAPSISAQNGKAERFIRTLLAGWLTAVSTAQAKNAAALDGWLWYYNHRPRHAALGHQPRPAEPNCVGLST